MYCRLQISKKLILLIHFSFQIETTFNSRNLPFKKILFVLEFNRNFFGKLQLAAISLSVFLHTLNKIEFIKLFSLFHPSFIPLYKYLDLILWILSFEWILFMLVEPGTLDCKIYWYPKFFEHGSKSLGTFFFIKSWLAISKFLNKYF